MKWIKDRLDEIGRRPIELARALGLPPARAYEMIKGIRRVQPDVLVKGADWPADQIVGRDTVEASGGKTPMVISGCATAAMDDGRVIEMRAGDVFYIGPGHDSWVVGDEPYVSLHFMGAEKYASGKE